MTRENFETFIERTLFAVVQHAELYTENKLPTDFILEYFHLEKKQVIGINNVIKKISELVYRNENEIFPCVDLVADRVSDNFLIIRMSIASFTPRPFQNGINREGPFVYGINQKLISSNINTESEEFKQRLKESGHYPLWTKKKNGL